MMNLPSDSQVYRCITRLEFKQALSLLENSSPSSVTRFLAFVDNNNDKNNCLHAASLFKAPAILVSKLIALGMDPNAPNIHGRTPVYLAARSNASLETIDVLVSKGGKLNGLLDHFSFTPLMAAAYRRSDVNLVGRLVRWGACVHTQDTSGNTAAKWARTQNFELNRRDNGLTIALFLENIAVIQTLLIALDMLTRKEKDECKLSLLPKDLLRLVRNMLVGLRD